MSGDRQHSDGSLAGVVDWRPTLVGVTDRPFTLAAAAGWPPTLGRRYTHELAGTPAIFN
ncbi:hypothetical protein [Halovenus marina]|uniref:hypothetical protein n=1 Tax=Halovenus marina TaxID=3396621 RepID=UPI003F56B5FC